MKGRFSQHRNDSIGYFEVLASMCVYYGETTLSRISWAVFSLINIFGYKSYVMVVRGLVDPEKVFAGNENLVVFLIFFYL